MKTYTTSTGEKVKITKSLIKEYHTLDRPVRYYPALDNNILAQAVSIAPGYFGYDGVETQQDRLRDMYEHAEEMIEAYIIYTGLRYTKPQKRL